MKKILQSKREYHFIDILKLFVLFIGHVSSWLIFAILLYLTNYLINENEISIIFSQNKFLSIYVVIVSSIVSYILHVVYSERGWTNVKAFLWIHSMAVIITSIMIFIFF